VSGEYVLDVSRETIDKLNAFSDLVQKWTAKINLISNSSIQDVWNRHILDSAQLATFAPDRGHWVDLGSGGGFPAIIVAIIWQSTDRAGHMTMVESDQRKAVFLRTAVRELGLEATVHAQRIEDVPPLGADVLSARALADLPKLLSYSVRHLTPNGIAIFPKGANWQKEHSAAQEQWSYTCTDVKSQTHSEAAILKIKDIVRV